MPRPFPFPINVGTDICSIQRIYQLLSSNGKGAIFCKKLFTDEEYNVYDAHISGGGDRIPGAADLKRSLQAINIKRDQLQLQSATAAQKLMRTSFDEEPISVKDIDVLSMISEIHSTMAEKRTPPFHSADDAAVKRSRFVAGRWAAKEAIIKAHRSRRLTFHDIAILPSSSGAETGSRPPTAVVISESGSWEDGQIVPVNISHDGDYAVATCLAYEPPTVAVTESANDVNKKLGESRSNNVDELEMSEEDEAERNKRNKVEMDEEDEAMASDGPDGDQHPLFRGVRKLYTNQVDPGAVHRSLEVIRSSKLKKGSRSTGLTPDHDLAESEESHETKNASSEESVDCLLPDDRQETEKIQESEKDHSGDLMDAAYPKDRSRATLKKARRKINAGVNLLRALFKNVIATRDIGRRSDAMSLLMLGDKNGEESLAKRRGLFGATLGLIEWMQKTLDVAKTNPRILNNAKLDGILSNIRTLQESWRELWIGYKTLASLQIDELLRTARYEEAIHPSQDLEMFLRKDEILLANLRKEISKGAKSWDMDESELQVVLIDYVSFGPGWDLSQFESLQKRIYFNSFPISLHHYRPGPRRTTGSLAVILPNGKSDNRPFELKRSLLAKQGWGLLAFYSTLDSNLIELDSNRIQHDSKTRALIFWVAQQRQERILNDAGQDSHGETLPQSFETIIPASRSQLRGQQAVESVLKNEEAISELKLGNGQQLLEEKPRNGEELPSDELPEEQSRTQDLSESQAAAETPTSRIQEELPKEEPGTGAEIPEEQNKIKDLPEHQEPVEKPSPGNKEESLGEKPGKEEEVSAEKIGHEEQSPEEKSRVQALKDRLNSFLS